MSRTLDEAAYSSALNDWQSNRDARCKTMSAALVKKGFVYTVTEQRSGGYDWALAAKSSKWSGHGSNEYESYCAAYETGVGSLPKDCWPQPKPVETDFMVEAEDANG